MVNRFVGFVMVLVGLSVLGTALTGCSSTRPRMASLEEELAQREEHISTLQTQLEDQQKAVQQAQDAARDAKKQAADAKVTADKAAVRQMADAPAQLLPPSATPGECFARVLVPPVYETATEQVMVKEAS